MILTLIFPLLFAPMVQLEELQTQRAAIVEEKEMHEEQKAALLCNCVLYVLQFRPDLPHRDASTYIPATTTPFVGAVAVMRYPSGAHHVAYVTEVTSTHVYLRHANVTPCTETAEWMSRSNFRILGYL